MFTEKRFCAIGTGAMPAEIAAHIERIVFLVENDRNRFDDHVFRDRIPRVLIVIAEAQVQRLDAVIVEKVLAARDKTRRAQR